ncbi:hypothetical protein [Curtobacterium sp. B8]|uniref:hypothetical protein n=1 Tax=Curtobacterium sp. B8 TaxID=95611 RepID=UPI00034BCEB1|nr:hypothetical protein [Curtobacterium sp. B8]
MTIVTPEPKPFGRSRVYTPNWTDDTTDADYEDLEVIAANIERERVAARRRFEASTTSASTFRPSPVDAPGCVTSPGTSSSPSRA